MAEHEKDAHGHGGGDHGVGHGGGHGEHGHEEEGHKGPPHEEKPPGAPGWIVSFADMIINLLCFFILMNTFANRQEAGLVADGIGSFRGLGITDGGPNALSGGEMGATDLGAGRVRYRPPKALNEKLLDEEGAGDGESNRDSLRSATKEALTTDDVSRLPPTFLFEPGKYELTQEHKDALDIVGGVLKKLPNKLRVDGYAYAEPCDTIRSLAAKRARAVADYLITKWKFDPKRVSTIGFGSSGAGADKHERRVVQDILGRRIALIYVVPKS